MNTPEREPCPFCAEPVALEATLCPHCGHEVLVDVGLTEPMTDPRARYQMARSLSALGPPLPGFVPLQTALGSSRPVAVEGVTRAMAQRCLEVVQAHGAHGVVTASRRKSRGMPSWVAGAGVAAVLTLAAGLGLWLSARGGGPPAPAPSPVAVTPQPLKAAEPQAMSSQEAAQRGLASTVSIRCSNGMGSGFFVSDDTVLTNAHVLCPELDIQVVLSDGRRAVGRAVRRDERLDLAQVRVSDAKGTPLPLGDAGRLKVGDRVLMVGNPMGLEFTVHEGMVSSLGRGVHGVAYIQLDARVNPGNSGGPLLDASGKVVGVVSLKAARAEGIGLALPINYAFSGPGPMLAPPQPAPDPAGFEAMLARVRSGEEETGAKTAPTKPMLVGAYVDQYQRVVFRIARIAPATPLFEEITLRFWMRGREACMLKADVQEWKQPQPGQLETGLTQWLAGRAWGDTVYVGESAVRLEQCGSGVLARGVVVELEGAEPEAARLTLQ